MRSIRDDKGVEAELKFLNNLKEDLRILENSWRSRNLHPKRVVKHFLEIIDSISEIARSESVEPLELLCADLKQYLTSVAGGKGALGERSWSMTSELMDLLRDSIREGSAAPAAAGLEELKARVYEETSAHQLEARETATGPARQASPPGDHPVGAQTRAQEENKMAITNNENAQELLQEAQKALLSGNGEGAKELALKAARLIAEAEAEELRKKEKILRVDLEAVIHEETDIENSVNEATEKIAGHESELASLTERLAQAQSAFDEREKACQKIGKEIDKVEEKLAEAKEKHKEVLDRFQEFLPARDAAERECTKIKAEYGDLPKKIETMRESLQELEHRLAEVRGRKTKTEAELEKLAEKTAA